MFWTGCLHAPERSKTFNVYIPCKRLLHRPLVLLYVAKYIRGTPLNTANNTQFYTNRNDTRLPLWPVDVPRVFTRYGLHLVCSHRHENTPLKKRPQRHDYALCTTSTDYKYQFKDVYYRQARAQIAHRTSSIASARAGPKSFRETKQRSVLRQNYALALVSPALGGAGGRRRLAQAGALRGRLLVALATSRLVISLEGDIQNLPWVSRYCLVACVCGFLFFWTRC